MRQLGPYTILGDIAVGGMATVRLGRHRGPDGGVRIVALKQLHAQHATDPELRSMLLDEAQVSARIRHPNVVATTDVVADQGEISMVMDYVDGESLADVLHALEVKKEPIPPSIASGVLVQALCGLQAAHDITDAHGTLLGLVHRDVSPQNIMLGVDGVVRVIDFGVAKAAGRMQNTRSGTIKGKLHYMAPEQLRNRPLSRKADVFAAGVVLWEMLVGERLFQGDEATVLERILLGKVPAPSTRVPGCVAFDAVVARATARSPDARYASATELAEAIERATPPAGPSTIAAWLTEVVPDLIHERATRVAAMMASAPAADAATPRASEPPVPRAAVRPTRRAWLAGALAVVAIAVVVGGVTRARAPLGPPAALPTPVVEAKPTGVVEEPDPAPSLASAAPGLRPESPPPRGRTTTVPRATVRPPRRPDCSIPYMVDKTGMKIYRRECLDSQ